MKRAIGKPVYSENPAIARAVMDIKGEKRLLSKRLCLRQWKMARIIIKRFTSDNHKGKHIGENGSEYK